MRCRLMLVPLLLAAVPPAAQTAAPDAATGQAHDLNFRVDTTGRMTVPVTIGNRGPYRFLVDTGAERTVISRQLATELGFGEGTRRTMQTVLGTSPVFTVNIPELQVSTRRVSIDGAPTLQSEHIGADGMLGVDTLASQQVTLDFKRKVMGISPSHRFDEHFSSDTIVITARRRHGRLLFTNASIGGRNVVVVVDTGSDTTVGNLALRQKLLRKGKPRLGELETVAGEKAIAEVVTVPVLRIGGLSVENVEIAFLDAPVFRQLEIDDRPAILLGMNILRAFDRVSIDFPNRQVRFVLPNTGMIRDTRMASR